jgi:deazaflavin-dependent oxidoreductase (nitroreductase family)
MSSFENYNQRMIEDFRTNREKGLPPSRPLVLLTTTGAKSGNAHTTPLRPFYDGDRLYVIASKGGAPSDPQWFRNLVANPEVTVEEGKETIKARAMVVTGTERDRLWANAVAIEPGFAEYQAKVTRQIPVIVLERL